MPSAQSDNRAFRLVGFALLFVILATIVFVFVKTLVFDRPINDQALKQALVAASVGVTLSCLIAWVLDLLQVIRLQPGWNKLLWTVLVASILGSSALAYKQFATQTDALSVACVRPVAMDESTGHWSKPIAVRSEESYKRGGFFGFLVVIRNLQTDPHGDYALDLRYEFNDGVNAAFLTTSYTGNAKKLGADPDRQKVKAESKKAAPDCFTDDRTVEFLIRSRLQPTDPRNGVHDLKIVVYDNVGKTFARVTLPTTIFE